MSAATLAVAVVVLLGAPGILGCGGRPNHQAAPSTGISSSAPIGNVAEPRSGTGGLDLVENLDGEWVDEVGSRFWFELDPTDGVTLVRATRSRRNEEYTGLETGTTDGEFWLRYDVPDTDTTVTITLHEWDDELGGYRCSWENGGSDGEGTLRPRARAEADGDLDDDDGNEADVW